MKYKSIAILIVCVSLAGTILAQSGDEEIGGAGTPNFIPQFVRKHRLGNSKIFQAGGSVGVNTTNPQATLDVESTDVFSIWGQTSSTAPFAAGVIGRSPSPTGNAVVGEATSIIGNNHGVFGRSASPDGAGVTGMATATTGNAYGVTGETDTTGFGAGVLGTATATSGNAFGVFGQASSPSGDAVFGYASATSGSPHAVKGDSSRVQTEWLDNLLPIPGQG